MILEVDVVWVVGRIRGSLLTGRVLRSFLVDPEGVWILTARGGRAIVDRLSLAKVGRLFNNQIR